MTPHPCRAEMARPDDRFPASSALLDSHVIADRIADRLALPARGPVGEGTPRLHSVHYYPQRSLTAVHNLEGTLVAVAAVAPDRPLVAHAGSIPLTEMHALAWPCTADPSLPSLASVLRDLGPAARMLAYVPGRRGALTDGHRVAKVTTAQSAASCHERQTALWNGAPAHLVLPRPLDVDPARALRWEAWVPGQHPAVWLRSGHPADLAGWLATALVALHHRDLSAAPVVDAAAVLGRVAKTARVIARVAPARAGDAADLVDRLRDALPPPARHRVTVHGDLTTANIAVRATDVGLLDLDEVATGDAEWDLALFATGVVLDALLGRVDWEVAVRLSEALPLAYADVTGRDPDHARYAWYLAACLAGRQPKTCVRRLSPGLDALLGILLAKARGTLAAGALDGGVVAPVAA